MRDEGTVFLGRTYVWIRQIAIKCTTSGANSVVQLQGRIYRCANSIAIDSQKARLESDVGGKRHTSITWGSMIGGDRRISSRTFLSEARTGNTKTTHYTQNTGYHNTSTLVCTLYGKRFTVQVTQDGTPSSKPWHTSTYLYDSLLVALRVLHGNCWYAF